MVGVKLMGAENLSENNLMKIVLWVKSGIKLGV